MRIRLLLSLAAVAALATAAETVQILKTDGKIVEGATGLMVVNVSAGGDTPRRIALSAVLSIHNGAPASAHEAARIDAGLAAIQLLKNEPIPSPERRNSDAAVEELAAIGLPVVTPLLRAFKDTDQHEPRPLYRLFERLIPGAADQLDREASLIRLASGEMLRGKLAEFTVTVNGEAIPWSSIRRLAVRRKSMARDVEVHSLRHSTQIEYFDTGVMLTAASALTVNAKGLVRLSWDTDGWATGAGGLTVPGPNYKTHLVDGHPFGALVARAGAAGEVFFVGAQFSKKGLAPGRLQLAVNDNRHWQNNVGAFRVTLQATDAYDTGLAQ